MELVKVLGIGIIGAVIASTLGTLKNEFGVYVLLVTGMIILAFILTEMQTALTKLMTLATMCGIDDSLMSGMIKIVGIGYITEFAAAMCRDSGASGLAAKMELAGKIAIFMLAVPLLNTLITLLMSLTELL